MLTLADIRGNVNSFPDDKPVEELLDERVLQYKVEKGLQEADEGKGLSPNAFNGNWVYGDSRKNSLSVPGF
jgi:hypothetical protein